MNYEDLANLLYPDVTTTIEDLEKKYPKRNLKEGAEVTRFAPSPTGRVHMGNLYASFIPEVFAHQTDGVFILRIEDTDAKRAIENGVQLILDDLKYYNYIINEDPIQGGNYGPYIQTERVNIYHTVAKYLVSIGRAYPCFCSEDDLNNMREHQEHKKERIGYYGKYAKCRNLTYDEVKSHIDNGDKWVLRLKSMGDFNKQFIFKDLIKGTIELHENDIDQVIVKSDGIPPYAFAHVCDDHFMRVTTVTRGEEYISSVPYHLELWNACGFVPPKFAHTLAVNIKDGNTVRKISKRKDPEAAISFYAERGVPTEAIKLYLATLVNTNFDGWLLENPGKSYRDFTFSFDKMSKSGPLFDLEKIVNISKNYISKLSAKEVYDNLLNWANEYDKEFADLITKHKDYTINILNIESEQKKPRKDFSCYSEIKSFIWYMYKELFKPESYEWGRIQDINEIKNILNNYFENYYNESDDKDTWFNKIKELTDSLDGFTSDMKAYKENPDGFNGNVADISTVIRVAVTTKANTPDLYEILRLLGKEEINNRISLI
jgi:glutamyl-tRNA synthetase